MIRHEVPMGHRLPQHQGKCRFPHGHNYLFEITVKGPVAESNGMIVDFSDVKKKVKEYLDRFDHAFLLDERDPLVDVFRITDMPPTTFDTKVIVLNCPPTAENIVQLVRDQLSDIIGIPLRVTVYETRDCSATAWAGSNRPVDIVEEW
jgi:6-pyruvoyltetrahydropterin/6-carboxytetrahydropterin synthase